MGTFKLYWAKRSVDIIHPVPCQSGHSYFISISSERSRNKEVVRTWLGHEAVWPLQISLEVYVHVDTQPLAHGWTGSWTISFHCLFLACPPRLQAPQGTFLFPLPSRPFCMSVKQRDHGDSPQWPTEGLADLAWPNLPSPSTRWASKQTRGPADGHGGQGWPRKILEFHVALHGAKVGRLPQPQSAGVKTCSMWEVYCCRCDLRDTLLTEDKVSLKMFRGARPRLCLLEGTPPQAWLEIGMGKLAGGMEFEPQASVPFFQPLSCSFF